ncbi:MAG TPA: hypothetical protein VH186_04655 [Chloroflexia bacterium]|nr:hypothetical protein [Chloroflexia bacterium]
MPFKSKPSGLPRVSLFTLFLLLLILVLEPLNYQLSRAASEESLYFQATGQTVSGKFLQYWQNKGGLLSYGYPITPARSEVSQTDDKTYLTQWFERSRFELHPENSGTAYEVQLGLLGNELRSEARQGDPDFTRAARLLDPALSSGQLRYFAETGHNLRSRFLEYWQNNGGLERFGFPISEEFRELDRTSGKVFLVQWFERARFELHPENQPPTDVVLGLLGSQLKQPTSPIEPVWMLDQAYSAPRSFSGLAIDGDGYAYMVDPRSGHLLKYDPGGKLVIWWDKVLPDGDNFMRALYLGIGVALDKQGNLYVAFSTDSEAGVRKYDRTGRFLQQLGSRGSGNGQFYLPTGLALDKAGNLYVVDEGGDFGEARVQKFDPAGRFLMSFGEELPGMEGAGIDEAGLNEPAGLVVDSQGNIFVVDTDRSDKFIRKYDSKGNFLLGWGSLTSVRTNPYNGDLPEPEGGVFGSGSQIFLPGPVGIAVDSQDNLYVTDQIFQRIQKFDNQGHFLAKFKKPEANPPAMYNSVALDKQNNLYATDVYNGRVTKFGPGGKLLLEYGATPDDKNIFGRQQIDLDNYFRLDGAGNFYLTARFTGLSDSEDRNYIQKYNSAGQLLYQLETTRNSTSDTRGRLINTDEQGNLYMFDSADGTIRKLDPAGKFLFKFGGRGDKDGQFEAQSIPVQVAADRTGNMYVAATKSPFVYKFDPAGNFLVKFGSSTGQTWQFNQTFPWWPYLYLDRQDNLYILINKKTPLIEKFDSKGTFLYSLAELPPVNEMALDSQGNLYLIDVLPDANNETKNRTVTPQLQKFDPTGRLAFKKDFPARALSEFGSFSLHLDGQDNFYLLWGEGEELNKTSTYRLEKYSSGGQLLFSYNASAGQYEGEFLSGQMYMAKDGSFYLVSRQPLLIQKFQIRQIADR